MMRLAPTNWSTSVVRKITTTLILGGGTYAITNTYDQPVIFSIMLSVFIGGVSLVTQFLIDFSNRLEALEVGQRRHLAAVKDMVRTRFANISEATELFGRVESSAMSIDLVKELAHHSANLDPSADQLIHLLAHSEIARVSDFMKELSQHSEITYDGEDRDWLLALTRNAQATIDATSFMAVDASALGFSNGGLWASNLGQSYLEEQQKALDRGVTIRRIFMLDAPEQAQDPELLQICEMQQKLGILVRTLDPLTLPSVHGNRMFDFILFDSVISYESTIAAWTRKGTKPPIVSTRLVLSEQRVHERAGGFEELWAAARELNAGDLPPRGGAAG
jgi:hypothetical protein